MSTLLSYISVLVPHNPGDKNILMILKLLIFRFEDLNLSRRLDYFNVSGFQSKPDLTELLIANIIASRKKPKLKS
jgi:hypothetical protein